MSQYEQFDKALLAEIADGNSTFISLEISSKLRKAVPASALGKPYFRTIDCRLQALRKAGKIHYQGKRWSAVK